MTKSRVIMVPMNDSAAETLFLLLLGLVACWIKKMILFAVESMNRNPVLRVIDWRKLV